MLRLVITFMIIVIITAIITTITITIGIVSLAGQQTNAAS